MLGVFAIIFTVGFSLQGVTGGSFSGSEVGGRRTCHGGSEKVNARSLPGDFWTVGSSGDFVRQLFSQTQIVLICRQIHTLALDTYHVH